MPWIAMTLVTLLALAGIFLVVAAGAAALIAAIIVIVARRQRRDTAPAVEPAD